MIKEKWEILEDAQWIARMIVGYLHLEKKLFACTTKEQIQKIVNEFVDWIAEENREFNELMKRLNERNEKLGFENFVSHDVLEYVHISDDDVNRLSLLELVDFAVAKQRDNIRQRANEIFRIDIC